MQQKTYAIELGMYHNARCFSCVKWLECEKKAKKYFLVNDWEEPEKIIPLFCYGAMRVKYFEDKKMICVYLCNGDWVAAEVPELKNRSLFMQSLFLINLYQSFYGVEIPEEAKIPIKLDTEASEWQKNIKNGEFLVNGIKAKIEKYYVKRV